MYNPNLDPRNSVALEKGQVPKGYFNQIDRYHDDESRMNRKNYWNQIVSLVMSRRLRSEMIEDAKQYTTQLEIEKLKRTNKPFYYYRASDLLRLEALQFKYQGSKNQLLIEKQIEDYKQILKEFKQQNPELFKKKTQSTL